MTAAESYQFTAHYDMAQQLSVVGIVVLRKIGNLLEFSHIMEKGSGKEKILFQEGTALHRNRRAAPPQGMLQQTSHKAVMHRLCRGMLLKSLDKRGLSTKYI